MAADTVTGFQVVLQLEADQRVPGEELEASMERAMPALLEDAKDVALGAVFGVNFEQCAVEIEFTIVADTHEQLHEKLNFVLAALAQSGFEYTGSHTRRLKQDEARDDERELVTD